MLHGSIVEAAAEAAGAEVQIIGPTLRGESGSTFAVRVGRDEAILKLLGPGVVREAPVDLARTADLADGRWRAEPGRRSLDQPHRVREDRIFG